MAECNCNDLFEGQPNGMVFWTGDELQVLPFPGFDATLQYVNGSPVWVNNALAATAPPAPDATPPGAELPPEAQP